MQGSENSITKVAKLTRFRTLQLVSTPRSCLVTSVQRYQFDIEVSSQELSKVVLGPATRWAV